MIADNAVTTAKIANAEVTLAKLENLVSGAIIVGNVSNRPTAVPISGNAVLSPTGELIITTGAITTSKIATGAVATASIADGAITNAKVTDVEASKITGTFTSATVNGKVIAGASSAASSSAILEANSTSQGFLPPRMTVAQRNNISSPADGLIIFNSSSNSLNIFLLGNWHQLSTNLPQGSITSLSANSPTNNGVIVLGLAASGVSSVVSYAGGNGETHIGQTVLSTDVTGLTATLSSGSFSSGSGTLTYTITGTPSSSGTASFALNIGGQTATLTRTVVPGSITSLDASSPSNNGSLYNGLAASGVNSVVSYVGGNGGLHSGQTVSSTGVTGLTATLASGNFSIGNGNLTYTITGTPSSGGTASFALNIGGKTATLTLTVEPGSITSLSAGSPTNNGTLVHGLVANGVSSVVSYAGGNGETHNGQTVSSTGVTGLTATLVSGNFLSGNGTLTYNITGTPVSTGTASFALNIGGQTATLTRTVVPGSITSLDASSPINNGSLVHQLDASGVSSVVSFAGGNGGFHNGQTVLSTGVTGLTATLVSGNFGIGNGTLTYNLTGRPASTGTASFALNIGGRTATLTINVASLAIGESYQGGKIAYILQSGDPGYDANTPHGLIAATSNQSNGIQWHNGNYVYTGAEGSSIGTGLSNTNAIISNQGTSTEYAARLARAHDGGGYNDWYLPSKDELNKLWINRVVIGNFGPFNFWSSTEANSFYAWYQHFDTPGTQGSVQKFGAGAVRAVRAF